MIGEPAGRLRPIDRRVEISFDGMRLEAEAGEPLAAALMAAGRLAIGASVSGRPRGLRAFDRISELSVTVEGFAGQFDPCLLPVSDRMVVQADGIVGSAEPAEPEEIDADILIVGGGVTGQTAAHIAQKAGANVCLVERCNNLWWHGPKLEPTEGIRVLTGLSVDGAIAGIWQANPALPGTRTASITARSAIIATGAAERISAFDNNDLPGIVTMSTLRELVTRYGVRPPGPIAIAGSGADVGHTAEVLRSAGIEPDCIAESTGLLEAQGGPPCAVVTAARGDGRLEAIEVATTTGTESHGCGCLAIGTGWSPSIAPGIRAGGRAIWNAAAGVWLLPPGAADGTEVAGAAGGSFGRRAAMKSAYFRTRKALTSLGFEAQAPLYPEGRDRPVSATTLWHVPGAGPAFVNFATDAFVGPEETAAATAAREIARPPSQ